jgi:hypothetical protein
MNKEELDALLEDTRRLARAADKVAQAQAIASIEIARQLIILNEQLAVQAGSKKSAKSEKPAARSARAAGR